LYLNFEILVIVERGNVEEILGVKGKPTTDQLQ
jgi:hypothetical protein